MLMAQYLVDLGSPSIPIT